MRRTGESLRLPLYRCTQACGRLLILACALPASGCCTLYYNAFRTLAIEPAAYCFKIDGCKSRSLYREWAEQELRQQSFECSNSIQQADFNDGFIDGFVEYVHLGGSGEPPPIPPRRYWNIANRSLAGRERVNQWYEGYRSGSRTAADGGYRAAGVIQSSYVSHSDYLPSERDDRPVDPTSPSPVEAPAPPVPASRSIDQAPLADRSPPPNPFAVEDEDQTPITEAGPVAEEKSAPPAPSALPPALKSDDEVAPVPDELDLPKTPSDSAPATPSGLPETAEPDPTAVTIKRAAHLFNH